MFQFVSYRIMHKILKAKYTQNIKSKIKWTGLKCEKSPPQKYGLPSHEIVGIRAKNNNGDLRVTNSMVISWLVNTVMSNSKPDTRQIVIILSSVNNN